MSLITQGQWFDPNTQHHYLTFSQFLTHIGHSEKILYMKFFLTVFIMLFSLQSLTKAEELGEFEIEGILLKESLLTYFDQKRIEEKKKRGFVYPKNDFN